MLMGKTCWSISDVVIRINKKCVVKRLWRWNWKVQISQLFIQFYLLICLFIFFIFVCMSLFIYSFIYSFMFAYLFFTGSKCYFVNTTRVDFFAAQLQCQSMKSRLVSIHSSKENADLTRIFDECDTPWIGLENTDPNKVNQNIGWRYVQRCI